ncbi:MAG: hypothetical protein AAF443_08645 [Chlamydiota bacterium]
MKENKLLLTLQEGEEKTTRVLDANQIKAFDLEGHNWHAHLLAKRSKIRCAD